MSRRNRTTKTIAEQTKCRDLTLVGNYRSDLYGQRFGQLTVLRIAERYNETLYWLCRCMCGKELIVAAQDLKKRKTRSCGKPMCIYKAMKQDREYQASLVNQ